MPRRIKRTTCDPFLFLKITDNVFLDKVGRSAASFFTFVLVLKANKLPINNKMSYDTVITHLQIL